VRPSQSCVMIFNSRLTRGILSNWSAFAVLILASFFLAPFIVHQLGSGVYGVWVLVNSLISYTRLLDLGLRGSVTVFVAREHSVGDHIEAGRTVSTVLWLRAWIAIALVVTSLLLARWAPVFFAVPEELWWSMRVAILVAGLNAAVNLVGGVFGAVLTALLRFDLVSGLSIVQTILRTAGVVLLLRSDYGIVALAVLELSLSIISNSAIVFLSLREYPELRVHLMQPARDKLRLLWEFSLYNFVINTSIELIYHSDALIVGKIFSPEAVTLYVIGGTLVEYFRQLVASMTYTFAPVASRIAAQKQEAQLQDFLIKGTTATLLVGLPIAVALFLRGPTFIQFWMGESYRSGSGGILRILLISQTFVIANMASWAIVYALGKQRLAAIAVGIEGILNLVLSTYFAFRIGLEGVAWGTVIPSILMQLFFWPLYVSRLVNLSVWVYVWRGWIKAYVAVIPFAIACYVVEQHWQPQNLLMFFLQMFAVLPFLAAGIAGCFWREGLDWLRSYTVERMSVSPSTTTR
jgi:O-antigen/teichoic acid export membrane protein